MVSWLKISRIISIRRHIRIAILQNSECKVRGSVKRLIVVNWDGRGANCAPHKPRLAPVNRLRFDKAAKQTIIDVAIYREDGAKQNKVLLMIVLWQAHSARPEPI
jgi:hypothetical protein